VNNYTLKRNELLGSYVYNELQKNYNYPFYHIISIYVSHSSLKLEKGSGSNSDSLSSNSCLLDSADHNGSLKHIRTNSLSESGKQFSDFMSLN
jgi:hypothetical protein